MRRGEGRRPIGRYARQVGLDLFPSGHSSASAPEEFADEVDIARHYRERDEDEEEPDPDADLIFWGEIKRAAITKALGEEHSKHGISWKNVISLGDSDFERYGTITAGQDYISRETEGGMFMSGGSTPQGVSKDGHLRRLRLKTATGEKPHTRTRSSAGMRQGGCVGSGRRAVGGWWTAAGEARDGVWKPCAIAAGSLARTPR